MLHYAVNRPLGALLGESDLTTMLPWLLRYSRMLEDRVRLNWAVRAFLWLVTVPANKVAQKREQYRTPPEAGSIIVKDESEQWEVNSPLLRGSDARHDLQAVRAMIDAGSGYPPHWRGDAGDISLATAQAMQGPTERHLLRRQEYFVWILEDILYHAYQRSAIVSSRPSLSHRDYSKLFQVNLPDISRFDNESLARSTRDLSQGFYTLASQISQLPPSLASQVVRLIFKFAGESISQDTVNQIRIREGTIQSHRPQIITPKAYESDLLEGFGDEAKNYLEWLQNNSNEMRILEYGFKLQKKDEDTFG